MKTPEGAEATEGVESISGDGVDGHCISFAASGSGYRFGAIIYVRRCEASIYIIFINDVYITRMSFTSFRNDECRIRKEMEIFTFPGRYQLQVPGPGATQMFLKDPQIRLQKCGANLMTNMIDVESQLFGVNRRLERDYYQRNEYTNPAYQVDTEMQRRTCYGNVLVDESRATTPAYIYREMELPRHPKDSVIQPLYYEYQPLEQELQRGECTQSRNRRTNIV